MPVRGCRRRAQGGRRRRIAHRRQAPRGNPVAEREERPDRGSRDAEAVQNGIHHRRCLFAPVSRKGQKASVAIIPLGDVNVRHRLPFRQAAQNRRRLLPGGTLTGYRRLSQHAPGNRPAECVGVRRAQDHGLGSTSAGCGRRDPGGANCRKNTIFHTPIDIVSIDFLPHRIQDRFSSTHKPLRLARLLGLLAFSRPAWCWSCILSRCGFGIVRPTVSASCG